MNRAEEKYQSKYQLRPYTTKDLYTLYGVSERTFKKWIQPFKEEVGQKQGVYFNVNQVKTIFQKLGTPGVFSDQ